MAKIAFLVNSKDVSKSKLTDALADLNIQTVLVNHLQEVFSLDHIAPNYLFLALETFSQAVDDLALERFTDQYPECGVTLLAETARPFTPRMIQKAYQQGASAILRWPMTEAHLLDLTGRFDFEAEAKRTAKRDDKRKRMLIIDDSLTMRKIIHAQATDLGWAAKTANDGEEALVLIQRESFDAILTDIFMPGIGGISFIKSLRKICQKTPVIAMTAGVQGKGGEANEALLAASRVGASASIAKPFKGDELSQILDQAFRSHTVPA